MEVNKVTNSVLQTKNVDELRGHVQGQHKVDGDMVVQPRSMAPHPVASLSAGSAAARCDCSSHVTLGTPESNGADLKGQCVL